MLIYSLGTQPILADKDDATLLTYISLHFVVTTIDFLCTQFRHNMNDYDFPNIPFLVSLINYLLYTILLCQRNTIFLRQII